MRKQVARHRSEFNSVRHRSTTVPEILDYDVSQWNHLNSPWMQVEQANGWRLQDSVMNINHEQKMSLAPIVARPQ
jgi:hypothetical protein